MRIAGSTRDRLYQWDLNQRLIVDECTEGTQVHFAQDNDGITDALMVKAYAEGGHVYAAVPNIMLQSPGTINVYIYLTVGEEAHTEKKYTLIVIPREKPAGYVYTETDTLTWEQLDDRLSKLEKEWSEAGTGESAVHYTPEEKTDDEKAQARKNIGAASAKDVEGKIGADELNKAVEDALTEAKESGMFDGEQGETGPQGENGEPGKDGYTPQKGVDYFDGKDGKDGIDGKDGYTPQKGVDYFDGADGADGKDGKDGYTPQKGIDYFDGVDGKDGADGKNGEDGKDGKDYILTEADKTEIAEQAAEKVSKTLTSEVWTFELEGGTTVDKKVVLA